MSRPTYSSQDIRLKILKARDELVANVEFIMECVYEDRLAMQAYKARFKDLRYRPSLGTDESGETTYGAPTELVLEPLAGKYRATINSLLQSIRLIESEILPEDNPEGSTANSNTKPEDLSQARTSLRDQFKALAAAGADDAPSPIIEPMNPITEPAPKSNIEPKPPKPWRVKPQRILADEAPKKEPVVEEPKSLENPAQLDAESERIRAELRGLKSEAKGGGMSRLREKYGKGKKD